MIKGTLKDGDFIKLIYLFEVDTIVDILDNWISDFQKTDESTYTTTVTSSADSSDVATCSTNHVSNLVGNKNDGSSTAPDWVTSTDTCHCVSLEGASNSVSTENVTLTNAAFSVEGNYNSATCGARTADKCITK
jgi:hypothetical protein